LDYCLSVVTWNF